MSAYTEIRDIFSSSVSRLLETFDEKRNLYVQDLMKNIAAYELFKVIKKQQPMTISEAVIGNDPGSKVTQRFLRQWKMRGVG